MKWSYLRLEMRIFNRLAAFAVLIALSFFASGSAFAKKVKSARAPASSAELPELDVEADVIPDQIKLLLAAADFHEKDKDFAAVIKTLRPKIDQLPRSGLLQLGRAYDRTADYANEIHAINLVVAKNPKDYVAQVQLGNADLQLKHFDEAATAFAAAKDLNAKYRPAYEGAWALLEATQDTAEARILVLDIVKIFGPDARTTAALCRMFSGEGFIPEKSEDACRTAIRIDPKNSENYVYLTDALTQTERREDADKTITDAAQRFPASENVLNLAGQMKADSKSWADSYRYYLASVKANPRSAKAQIGLAKSAFALQKHGEAIDAFVDACKLDRRTMLDFRQAATDLKKNKDQKWLKYQDAINDRCE